MNGANNLCKLILGLTSLTLSFSVSAYSSDNDNYVTDSVTSVVDTTANVVTSPFVGWRNNWNMDTTTRDYLVTDSYRNKVKWLDGIDNGQAVCDQGNMLYDNDYLQGNTITNVHTQKSGVITGIRDQGTMDVTTPAGKNIRYQYIMFKVKPL